MSNLFSRVDIGRALIAITISILLFAYVRTEANPPEIGSYEVPIDVLDVPPGLLLSGGPPPSVRVRVNAPRDTLSGIRSSSLRAYIDLRKGKSGIDEYPVGVEMPDPRVRLMDVVPSEIPVRLEELVARRVPVRVNRTGAVPFGYEAGPAEFDPTEIAISGPISLLQRVAGASVDVKLDGVTVNIDAPHTVALVDAQGQSISTEVRSARTSPETVRVRVPINQQLSYKTVAVRAAIVGSADSGYSIDGIAVDPSTVTVVGGPQALRTVDVVDSQPIEVADATATFSRQVPIRVPEGVSLAGEATVRITVRVTPLIVLQPFSLPISVAGLQPGLQAVTPLPFVQAVVRGPSPVVRALDPDQLRASVDLTGQGPGVHEVNVLVTVPGEVNLQSVTPNSIALRLASATAPSPAPTLEFGPIGLPPPAVLG